MTGKLQTTNETDYRKLLDAARAAVANSYCPYSKFAVGSAILSSDGRIFAGCNVENANLAGGICAERTAAVKAVSDGAKGFSAVAIYSPNSSDCWPCGLCRQFLSEFGRHLMVVVETAEKEIKFSPLASLLPVLDDAQG